jgi:hypothetical protein
MSGEGEVRIAVWDFVGEAEQGQLSFGKDSLLLLLQDPDVRPLLPAPLSPTLFLGVAADVSWHRHPRGGPSHSSTGHRDTFPSTTPSLSTRPSMGASPSQVVAAEAGVTEYLIPFSLPHYCLCNSVTRQRARSAEPSCV